MYLFTLCAPFLNVNELDGFQIRAVCSLSYVIHGKLGNTY